MIDASTDAAVAGTRVAAPSPVGSRRGRRRTHAERWTKVTVVLLDRQIVYLDRLAADIRAASAGAISRTQIIRALVDALAESDISLIGARSETDLRNGLTGRLRRQGDDGAQ